MSQAVFDLCVFDEVAFNEAGIIQKAIGGVLSFAGSVVRSIAKNVSGALTLQGVLQKATSKVIGGAVSFVGGIIWVVGRRLKMWLFQRPYLDMVVETKTYRDVSTETREVKP